MARLHPGVAGSLTAQDPDLNSARTPQPSALNETARMVIVAAGLLLAVQLGAVIADAFSAYTLWLMMLCYVGPVVAVAAIFWAIGRRL
jgi:hypothetical protein